jgi:PadR family transcriptional regulator PadR
MYLCLMYSSELIKGTLKTIVLKMLKDNGKMYGYEITQRVKELTSERIQLTEGALYPTLHALEASGEVEVETAYIGKRIRKYYQLTSSGKTTAKNRIEEWQNFVSTLEILLDLPGKKSHGIANG